MISDPTGTSDGKGEFRHSGSSTVRIEVAPATSCVEAMGVLAVQRPPAFSTPKTTVAPAAITALIFCASVCVVPPPSGVTTQFAGKDTVPTVSFVTAVVRHFGVVNPA